MNCITGESNCRDDQIHVAETALHSLRQELESHIKGPNFKHKDFWQREQPKLPCPVLSIFIVPILAMNRLRESRTLSRPDLASRG